MTAAAENPGKRVTFRELFDHHPLVEIPIIQRDYAQGRDSAEEVRSLFLDAMYKALAKETGDKTLPLDLDFVYGSIEAGKPNAFCPLDGQQRLTTLFLLHWYLGWADERNEDFRCFASSEDKSRFAYAVRSSAGEFFDQLVCWFPDTVPADVSEIGSLIEDQPWFFQWWKRDPTIQSALTMLESIHETFRDSDGFYGKLAQSDSPYITFQLLDLDNFGLSDDLYIKMNARGKALTDFETFKALVEKHIKREFPEPDARELLGNPASLTEYFSHKIDTTWAELLWSFRDKKSHLFDARMMNLIRALGIITRDPDSDNVDNAFDTLREEGVLSFQKYLECSCLDRSHVELLITLLDELSGTSGTIRTHLPNRDYFDEAKAFNGILLEGGRSTYAELIQFSAYAHFFRIHGEDVESDRFGEWMRVVRNLTINSNIERPLQFKRGLRAINELLTHSGKVLEFFVDNDCKLEVFSVQQIREERIKAGLVLKSERWKDAVFQAEQHGYFNGQIEFLLDFSGVVDAWKEEESCDWEETDDDGLFDRFVAYYQKACLLFDGQGLIELGKLRTERALLALGNYMFTTGRNRSFLENSEDPISWKRLLRGEQLNKPGMGRRLLHQLLDGIDLKVGVVKSLDRLIASSSITAEWRRLIVGNPKLIEYCLKRQIRFISESNVYLLRGVRRSGEHVELFSYQLFLGPLAKKYADGDLAPFRRPEYDSVHTDSDEPRIRIPCTFGKKSLRMEIVNFGGTYRMWLYPLAGKKRAGLKSDLEAQPEFKFDEDGDLCLDVDTDKIEATIDQVAGIVRRHVSE